MAGEYGMGFASGAHESGADGGDLNAFLAEFGVEAFGEPDEGEFAGDVGEKVGYGDFAADAGDVDDGWAFVAGFAIEKVGQRGMRGVKGGEEVGGHGAAEGGDGLIFDWTDFDDSGVIDEDVDASEVVDGVVDQHNGLGGVGEVGGDEEDVVERLDGSALEQGLARGGELVEVTCGKNEFGSGASVAICECETEAARAAGDEHDLAGTSLLWP
jgi:hypothetical protein